MKQITSGWILIMLLALSCGRKQDVYLFSSFREPATDGMYLAYSYDGYHWTDLGGPFLRPQVGNDSLMRDPSIVRDAREKFHLVWTCSWTNENGFGYAWSDDLVNWSPQKFIPVMQHEPTTVNVWAPELYYDEGDSTFIIIWASTIPYQFERGIEDERNNHRMYYTTTTDFEHFTETMLFLDPGFSIIDAIIVKRAEKDFILVLKDNTRPNRNLKVAFGQSRLGPWSNISEPFTEQFTEGPTVLKTGNEWLIYFDAYRENNYGAVRTADFRNFEDISDEISLPEGHKHGTIFRADKEILRGLKNRSAELMQPSE
jgi:hypothetical protein